MTDRIGAAVQAVEAPAPEPRATITVKLGSDRSVLIDLPTDLTAVEMLGLVGHLASPQFVAMLASARGHRPSPILVPHHVARG